jgi:hypothetical protein
MENRTRAVQRWDGDAGAVHVLAAADSWRWDDATAPGNGVV